VPNPQWWARTKPKLDRVIFRVITDATQEPIALQNNEVQVIYPQPQVDLVTQVAQIPGSRRPGLGLQWEHFDFNLINPFLPTSRCARRCSPRSPDDDDRQDGRAVQPRGQAAEQPHVHAAAGRLRRQHRPTGQGTGDIEKAKKILTDAGYTGVGDRWWPRTASRPVVRMRYTVGNAIRQSECELFASA
jgi:peptide/nickel transport system substrate-binding protein